MTAADTTSPEPIVAVFGASKSLPGDAEYEAARRCGRLLGESGFAVLTGGYGGSMEAASRGAAEAGARVIGVTAPSVFSNRSGPNRYVGHEIAAPTLTKRIDIMLDMASAAVALDGSIGTLTELLVAWNVAYVSRFTPANPKPVVAIGERWRAVVPYLAAALDTDGSLVTVAADVDSAVMMVTAKLDTSAGAAG